MVQFTPLRLAVQPTEVNLALVALMSPHWLKSILGLVGVTGAEGGVNVCSVANRDRASATPELPASGSVTVALLICVDFRRPAQDELAVVPKLIVFASTSVPHSAAKLALEATEQLVALMFELPVSATSLDPFSDMMHAAASEPIWAKAVVEIFSSLNDPRSGANSNSLSTFTVACTA
jgi:hypothetical protein